MHNCHNKLTGFDVVLFEVEFDRFFLELFSLELNRSFVVGKIFGCS